MNFKSYNWNYLLISSLLLGLFGCSQSSSDADATLNNAVPDFSGAYTSDPFSMLQRFGAPKLTDRAQQYWDAFTPDMDPAIQCLPSTLARDLFSPAGILVEFFADGNLKLSLETVSMDGSDFPEKFALEKRGEWPVSETGYSTGYWQEGSLFVETRGVIERDILMGHIPILPSEQLIIKREFKLVGHDQRWEARGLAPQEANHFLVSGEDGGRTLEMDVWLDDPKNLNEVWHTVKQYREISEASHVSTAGDIPVVDSGNPAWEQTDAAANSGVPAEFLENYDGGCVLFPEYDIDGEGSVGDFVPQ